MTASKLVYDNIRVLPFMQGLIVGLHPGADARCIGLERNGALVAGAMYEGFNGRNIWVHLAGAPGTHWMTRTFLRAGFAYPFLVCGVDRLSGYVNAANAQVRRLNEHLGYEVEATLRGAAPDGGDVLIYVMWKRNCRYV